MLPSYAPMRNTYLQQLLLLWFCHEHKLVVKTCAEQHSVLFLITLIRHRKLKDSPYQFIRTAIIILDAAEALLLLFLVIRHSFVALSWILVWCRFRIKSCRNYSELAGILWQSMSKHSWTLTKHFQFLKGFHGLTMTMQLCLKQRVMMTRETKVNKGLDDQRCKPFLWGLETETKHYKNHGKHLRHTKMATQSRMMRIICMWLIKGRIWKQVPLKVVNYKRKPQLELK